MTIISTTGDYLALPNKYISGGQREREWKLERKQMKTCFSFLAEKPCTIV